MSVSHSEDHGGGRAKVGGRGGKKMGKRSTRKMDENSERAEMLKWEVLAEREPGFLEILRHGEADCDLPCNLL